MGQLTVFLGNLIDMSISGSHIVPSPALEFFFYAFLMAFVICIFIFLGSFWELLEASDSAMQYTYREEMVVADSQKALTAETTEDTSV